MTLAAVSSSAVRTMAGSRAACDGRVMVRQSAVTGARMNTTNAGAARLVAAATPANDTVSRP